MAEIKAYPPNSDKARAAAANRPTEPTTRQDTTIKPITNATVKKKNSFFQGDLKDVKDFVIHDLIIPSAKKLLETVLVESIRMTLNGGSGNTNYGSRFDSHASDIPMINYDKHFRVSDTARVDSSGMFAYTRAVISSHRDAENVLDALDARIRGYGIVRVSDLNEMLHIRDDYTTQRYGWTSIRGARVVQVRDGYMLELPRPALLD